MNLGTPPAITALASNPNKKASPATPMEMPFSSTSVKSEVYSTETVMEAVVSSASVETATVLAAELGFSTGLTMHDMGLEVGRSW